jgi:hypothetical protein
VEASRPWRAGEATVEEGEVTFFYQAAAELVGQVEMGLVVLGDEDDTGGVLVEAVDDTGAQGAAHGGEASIVMEKSVDQRAAGPAGAGMDDEAGGLVDGDKVVIFIKNVEGNIFGLGAQGRPLDDA